MSKSDQLAVGASAPDFTLLDIEGQSVTLASLWANGPTILTFLRHFG
ncbi:MAG: hypothetical protein SF123_09495 [Chloroflexota bacterium]|nr:hypothetical protein [Chloroflexota bacterium]